MCSPQNRATLVKSGSSPQSQSRTNSTKSIKHLDHGSQVKSVNLFLPYDKFKNYHASSKIIMQVQNTK
jgi:hypothetical protein